MHGHGQCARCGANVEPCCSGASALDEADEALAPQGVEPHLFERMFEELGGRDRSVTRSALLYALQRWLGGGLPEAGEILEAGIRLGHLRQSGAALQLVHRPSR